MTGRKNRKMETAAAALAMSMVALALSACGPVADQPMDREEIQVAAAVDRAQAATRSLGEELMAALSRQLETAGPEAAISVCSEIAPAAASELSRDGVEIRRTSLRYRNPENAPDAWERSWLERLDRGLATGEPATEVHEMVVSASGERYLRYLRPIVVGPNCLPCHGAEGDLSAAVRERLAQLYPSDRATGYAAGDLRGAFSVRVRLDGS